MADTLTIRLYSLMVNTGFAPCRFAHSSNGYRSTALVTLANCMADMRRVVKKGEWVAGVTPNRMTNRLAYLMRVDGVYPRDMYWKKFEGSRIDCVYRPNPRAPHGFDQLRNPWHGAEEKRRDMKSNQVLWSKTFFWFAQSYDCDSKAPHGLALPSKYGALRRSHRSRYGMFVKVPRHFLDWVARQPRLQTFKVIDNFGAETRCGQCVSSSILSHPPWSPGRAHHSTGKGTWEVSRRIS